MESTAQSVEALVWSVFVCVCVHTNRLQSTLDVVLWFLSPWFLGTGFLACLQLIEETRLITKTQRPQCLHISTAGIISICCHAQNFKQMLGNLNHVLICTCIASTISPGNFFGFDLLLKALSIGEKKNHRKHCWKNSQCQDLTPDGTVLLFLCSSYSQKL